MLRTVIAFAAIVVLLACGKSSPAVPTAPTVVRPSTPQLRVSGRVLDLKTHQGVEGMVMTWTGILEATPSRVIDRWRSVSGPGGFFEVTLDSASYFVVNYENTVSAPALVRVPFKSYETDLLVNADGCVFRYGTVIDAASREPVAGARVSHVGFSTQTDSSGKFALDLGCGRTSYGIGTSQIRVDHPAYETAGTFDNRAEAMSGVRRVDFELQRR